MRCCCTLTLSGQGYNFLNHIPGLQNDFVGSISNGTDMLHADKENQNAPGSPHRTTDLSGSPDNHLPSQVLSQEPMYEGVMLWGQCPWFVDTLLLHIVCGNLGLVWGCYATAATSFLVLTSLATSSICCSCSRECRVPSPHPRPQDGISLVAPDQRSDA